MGKICFAVPTFPEHYLYALDFMKSFTEYHYDQQADLFLSLPHPKIGMALYLAIRLSCLKVYEL